jgi:hypothetical protein
MRPIPKKLRNEMNADPYYKVCCMNNRDCEGRLEWHHTIIHSGRQLNEKWAIVPACKHHHDNDEEQLQLLALNRATIEELSVISKAIRWVERREYLRAKYSDASNITDLTVAK